MAAIEAREEGRPARTDAQAPRSTTKDLKLTDPAPFTGRPEDLDPLL